MAEITGFYKPEITLKSGGKILPFNRLMFDSSAAGFLFHVDDSEPPVIGVGSLIKAGFSWNGHPPEAFFSSQVQGIIREKGNTYRIVGREKYYRELTAPLSPVTWRESHIKEVLRDLFEVCGVDQYDLTGCDDLQISRFSIPAGQCGYTALSSLKDMIRSAYGLFYHYLSAPVGTFLFGEIAKIRPEMSEPVSFEAGVNIISRSGHRMTAFALPVMYNQKIFIDKTEALCRRSILTALPGKYRVIVELRE